MTMSTRFVANAALLTMALGANPVFAERRVEVFLSVKAPASTNQAPQIEATIVGASMRPVDSYTLGEANCRVPYATKAVSVRPFTPRTEPLAVAFVFNGQEVWIGNTDYEPEDSPARYRGILNDLKTALRGDLFATAGADSKGMLISYADTAEVRTPMGPLTNIDAERFGTQRDYNKKFGTAMVDGIRLALTELERVSASRKALVVIGDGNDTEPKAASALLGELKRQAARAQIDTFAIIYKGQLSEDDDVITTMIPNATTVTDDKSIRAALEAIMSRMADHHYVTFASDGPMPGHEVMWDGKAHDLVVSIDQTALDPVTITLPLVMTPPPPPAPSTPPSKGGFPSWIAMLGGALLLLLIGAGLGRVRASKDV